MSFSLSLPCLTTASTPAGLRRYVAVETGINMAINTGIACSGLLVKLVTGAPVHGPQPFSVTDALPFLVMTALMSVVMPALLTRRRHLRGSLPFLRGVAVPRGRHVVAIGGVAVAVWLLAALPPALLLLGHLASGQWGSVTVPVTEALYGVLAAAVLTPATMCLAYDAS